MTADPWRATPCDFYHGLLTSDELPEDHLRIHNLLMTPQGAATSSEALSRILEERGVKDGRLGVEMEGLPMDRQAELRAALPSASLLDCSNLIRLIRMVKNEYEIDLLTRSAEINEQAGMQVLAEAVPGQSLQDLPYAIGYWLPNTALTSITSALAWEAWAWPPSPITNWAMTTS